MTEIIVHMRIPASEMDEFMKVLDWSVEACRNAVAVPDHILMDDLSSEATSRAIVDAGLRRWIKI